MVGVALLVGFVAIALLAIRLAVVMQRRWSVDGEVRDPAKRQWMRVLLMAGASIFIMIWLQIFYAFNPPPPGVNRGPSQTQR
jgi:hypothetical protein